MQELTRSSTATVVVNVGRIEIVLGHSATERNLNVCASLELHG